MAFVNVRRDVDDKFYRYRMPVMLTKVEGRGNGIKTVIPNMSDVSKALSRPPQYPTKFFGCELGAQTILDEKADRWIVNGEHNADRLRELLDAFIDKFVLCGACKNPETELVITKTEDIIRDCKACGQQTKVDMRHKLTTFIIKNPPKKKKSRKTTKDSQQDKEKGEEGGSGDDGSPTADNDDDDALAQRLQAEAAELPDVEKAAIAADDWSADTKADAASKRMADLALDDDEGEASGDHFGALVVWLEINREQATPASVLAKLDELGIKERHKTAQILGESLFTGSILSNKEIQKFLPVFKEVIMPKNASEVEKKEKHQKALLGGMERLVGVHYPDLVPQIPRILMEWYQADILTEEVVRQWGTHVSKKYVDRDTCKRVRKASEPFLKWLDEAEDEEDSDDE